MRAALKDAKLEGSAVDYVNAHATSTPMGDEIEVKVIDRVCGSNNSANSKREKELYVSSTKGATGHLLGAAGSLEAAFTVQGMVEGVVPMTLNCEQRSEELSSSLGYSIVTEKGVEADLNVVMTNSFGFGGTNVSLVFKKFKE
jgi:3-oxoacyl-[acyl-carrier-protein] synthase II